MIMFFVVVQNVDTITISSWEIEAGHIALDILRMVFLKHLSCFSVNNLQFSHCKVEYWDTVCKEWYSIHIDGVDGVLTVQLAFHDHL